MKRARQIYLGIDLGGDRSSLLERKIGVRSRSRKDFCGVDFAEEPPIGRQDVRADGSDSEDCNPEDQYQAPFAHFSSPLYVN